MKRTGIVAVSLQLSPNTLRTVPVNPYVLNQENRFYEFYDPQELVTPQRQQQNISNPFLQRHPSVAASTSTRSLRRISRLQPRRKLSRQLLAEASARSPREEALPTVAFTQSGSTTPQAFQKLVEEGEFWPQRNTRISRRTHEAILFALEAVRTGRGVDAKQLTRDQVEEEARMSELYVQNPQGQATTPARRDEAARAQAEAARIQTPRDIMAARNAREARRAQQEARSRQDLDPTRRGEQEDVVGVGADPRRQRDYTQQSQPSRSAAEAAARIPPGQSVTIGGRSDTIPAGNGTVPRGTQINNQGQPRPVQQTRNQMQPEYPVDTSRIERNRTEAYEKLDMPPAIAGSQPQNQTYATRPEQNQIQRAGFPHAFERWETLSSHWEGLTSYWIAKLQENTNDLDRKPIDKQMARQITDLSAAGANLFHAVVELQRLRASSERKFQRWFADIRIEQEQSREEIARLQAQLQQEKQKVPVINNASVDEMTADKNKAEELVREMRRELQISKEEARRAWEELGRREQEERERTIALRSGEPTLIGGVQVLPMQGLSSRHNTAGSQRPVTRDGPYTGGPTATMMGGQQPGSASQTTLDSPTQEQSHFNFEPNATSPTDTDPFTETSRPTDPPLPLRHEPDTRFVSTGSPAARQTNTSQSMSAARAAIASPTQSQRSTQGPSYIPSTRSGAGSIDSGEEYHTRSDGTYILDPQGRRIPYRQPIGGYEDIASDDEDHTADVLRERQLAEQYAQRQQAGRATQHQQPTTSHTPGQSVYSAVTSPQTQHTGFDNSPDSRRTTSSTVSPVTPQQHLSGRLTSPMHDTDYEGAGYGEPEPTYPPPTTAPGGSATSTATTASPYARQHHVPTRLSDILEERTEASRTSTMSNPPTTYHETQGWVFGTRR